MKRKIFFMFFIISLILGFQYSKVFAETSIEETISAVFPNCNTKAEYRVEIKDSKNTKITVTFKGITIIECYAENDKGKFDLKPLSKIECTTQYDNTYALNIENITDMNYQLDYTEPFQYLVYEDNKLKKEEKTKAFIDETKRNARNICCTFRIEYDKKGELLTQTYILWEKVYKVSFIIALVLYSISYSYNRRHKGTQKYGGIVNEKNVDYCRELPKWIDLELAYASLYHYSRINEKKLKNGIIGAFILKWSNDNNVIITDKGNKVFSIDLGDGNFNKTENEQELYDLLKMAAGSNNIIDNKEFKIWSRSNKNLIEKWHNKLLASANNENLRPEAEALLGLKKFLLDNSLIDERRHIEVKIWEDYLIYAQLLGIADKVSKQFAKIYPDYSKISQLFVMSIDDIMFQYIMFLIRLVVPASLAMVPAYAISVIYYFTQLR